MKPCSKCKRVQPFTEFYRDRTVSAGCRSRCKTCHKADVTEYRLSDLEKTKARQQAYYQRNKERIKATTKEYYGENRDRMLVRQRDYWLRSNYGISDADYERLFEAQGGVCGICGGTEPGGNRRFFSVDHDHETGVVRGLLCGTCNFGIGALRDDPELLKAAIQWLTA